MELIKPEVELITEADPFKKIEMAGRTCYKSENNITKESAMKFYNNLVKHEHTAMLEHATFVFEVNDDYIYNECCENNYLKCTQQFIQEYDMKEKNTLSYRRRLVSGNLRAINESNVTMLLYVLYKHNPALVYNEGFLKSITGVLVDSITINAVKLVDIGALEGLLEQEKLAHTYKTVRITCDRGVSHELVRHRPFSFAQESTRYVNYSKNTMQFIEPCDYGSYTPTQKAFFIKALEEAERYYNYLVNETNMPPQNARALLPNALKTEIVITGNMNAWNHFFDLRYFGTTGKPHPDMKVVAEKVYKLFS